MPANPRPEHPRKTKHKSPPRTPFRWVVFVLVVLLVVAGAAWATLAFLFPPEKVRGAVQRQLSISLARDVRFTGAWLSIWPPVRLRVTQPALAEPGGFAAGTMLRARSLDLDLDVVALLRRRLVVRRLTLEAPELHLLLRADGTTNLDGLGRPASNQPPRAQRPMDLSVRELAIHGGRALVDDLKARRRIALGVDSNVSLELRQGARYQTRGSTTVADLAFGPLSAARMSDLDRSLAKLRWRIDHHGVYDAKQDRLALETLALRFGRTRLALSGLVQDPGLHPILDLKARGTSLDVAEILSFLAHADARALQGIHGRGDLDFDLAIRGALNRPGPSGAARLPDLIGTMRVRNGALEYPGVPAKIEGVSFHARFAPDSFAIPDLAARVEGQPIRARFAATHFTDPHVAFAARGNLELAALERWLVPKDGAISGRAAIDVAGNGRARDPGAMALDGRAQLANVRVKQPGLAKEIEDLHGAIEFSRTRASVSKLAAKAGGSSFALDATIERPLALMAARGSVAPAELQFLLESPRLDLEDVMPHGGGDLTLPNARGGGRVAIGKLFDKKLELANVTARVSLEPGVLSVPGFAARAYGGLASGNATLDARDPKHPRIATDAKLDSARIEQLLRAFVPPGDWLTGSLGSSIDLTTNLADPRGSLTAAGLAALFNGSLEHAPMFDRLAQLAHIPAFRKVSFDALQSTFRIVQGRVFTGPATLHGPDGDWIFGGSIGLDGTLDYAVSVTLPPPIVQRLGASTALAAGALADEQGRILMDFRVTGPARAPRVAWDPAAMKTRIAGRVSQAIEEQKQKFEKTVRDTLLERARAAQDSARAAAERYRKAVEDSLKRKGRGLLEGFFKKGAPPTPEPPTPPESKTPADSTPH